MLEIVVEKCPICGKEAGENLRTKRDDKGIMKKICLSCYLAMQEL